MAELWTLLLVFARLGLLSLGAAISVLPEMTRQLVDVHGWLSLREFTDGYALGQLAPGPNMLAVFFFGFRIAGIPGAVAAGLGMFGPPLIIALLVSRVWSSFGAHPWAVAARRALLPVGAGLMAGGVLTLARGAIHSWHLLLFAVLSALAIYKFNINPALAVIAAGVLGMVGSVFLR